MKEKSPTSVKDVKDLILASSKSILGKVLSPTKEKLSAFATKISESNQFSNNDNAKQSQGNNKSTCDMTNSDVVITKQSEVLDNKNNIDKITNVNSNKPQLMTRRELTDPFGSDEEDNIDENIDQSHNNVTHKNNEVEKDGSEYNQKQVL